jgi:lysophospholipase L1-like esterase
MKNFRILPIAAGILIAAAGALAQAAPNFTHYVALGDSLTAGWESGCLADRHQLHSYPALLATSMGHTVAGVGDTDLTHFQQPLISEPGIPPCYGATLNPDGTVTIAPISNVPGSPENATLARPYDNLGIPGAHSYDLVDVTTSPAPTDANANLYTLILRNFDGSPLAGTSAVLQAIGETPTFVTVWIGNNDVLDAAGSGTAISDSCTALNGDSQGRCFGVTITDINTFTTKYTEVLQTLRGGLPNATIAVANIPDVTAIPFTTTIAPVVVNPATRQPVLGPDGNPIPLIGEQHDGTPAPLPPDTLVTLGAATLEAELPGIGIPCLVYMAAGGPADFCVGVMPGSNNPNPQGLALPDGKVVAPGGTCNGQVLPNGGLCPGVLLYADEVTLLQAQTAQFNAAIATTAGTVGAQVYDTNSVFNDIRANGRSYAGVRVTASFLTGGIFSYDGVHPSNAGYAVTADEWIKWINSTYGSNLPRPNVLQALFTPDTPGGAAGGAIHHKVQTGRYPAAYWRRVLNAFPPASGLGVGPLFDSRLTSAKFQFLSGR